MSLSLVLSWPLQVVEDSVLWSWRENWAQAPVLGRACAAMWGLSTVGLAWTRLLRNWSRWAHFWQNSCAEVLLFCITLGAVLLGFHFASLLGFNCYPQSVLESFGLQSWALGSREFLDSSTSVPLLVPVGHAACGPRLCSHKLFFPWDPDGFRLQDVLVWGTCSVLLFVLLLFPCCPAPHYRSVMFA